MVSRVSPLQVSQDTAATIVVLAADGVLDTSTYRTLRDHIIKAALDEPRAVVVDVDALQVPADSEWTVFPSARWHVGTWPDIPIVLACTDANRRATIRANGVTRYVPVYPTVADALAGIADDPRPVRRRFRIELPAASSILRRARDLVAEQLTAWSHDELTPTASIIATVFVENVLHHTTSAPVLVLESYRRWVALSVQDNSATPAARREDPVGSSDRVSGLAIVAATSRAWGSMPTPHGKTVWAVIGSENRL